MHIVECLTHSKLGGGQSVVFTLISQLQQLHPELRCTVLLPPAGLYAERFRTLGVDVVEFPLDSVSLLNIFRSGRLLRALRPDVIHSHGKGAGLYARLLPSSFFNTRRVHSFHGFHPPDGMLSSFMYRLTESYLLSHTDTVIAISGGEAAEIRNTFTKGTRVSVIPNAVDCDDLHSRSLFPLPSDLESFLSRNAKQFIVTMIGRNDPVKNFDLAFEAARLVLEKSREICFVFVGINENDAECAKLLNLFPEHVRAISSLDDAAALINKSNVLLLTSKKEGSPLVVQEAFCFGKPVVGTNVEGICESVQHGVNGLLCSVDAESISQAIENMASDGGLYKKCSQNAFITANKTNIVEWAERYYQEYLQRGQ